MFYLFPLHQLANTSLFQTSSSNPLSISHMRLYNDSLELSHPSSRPLSPAGDSNVSSVPQTQSLVSLHSSSPEPCDNPPRPFWHKVGTKGLLVVSIGSLLLIGLTLFLCFLWLEAERARKPEQIEPQKLWQEIVLAGWMTRAVTIVAAIIRIVIRLQAAVVAAMVAAFIIETGVHLSQLPVLSIARAVNLSPLNIAIPATTSLRRSPKWICLPLPLIIITCLLTLGSQFISTILLSDFGVTNIASPANVTNHLVRASDERGGSYSPWDSSPQTFWRFAEYHEPIEDQLPHIADTGPTLRASLPWIDESSRVKLRSYSGEALVWDARFVCHSPSLTNASFNAIYTNIYSSRPVNPNATTHENSPTAIRIQGSVVYDEPDHPLRNGERLGPDSFNCTMPWNSGLAICQTTGSSRLRSPYKQASGGDGNDKELVNVQGSVVFYLDSSQISHSDLTRLSPLEFIPGRNTTDWAVHRDGPWTQVLNSTGQPILSLSHCVNDPRTWYLNATMNGTSTSSEPAIKWASRVATGDAGSDSIITLQVRKQLGATREMLSPQDRGIIVLQPPILSGQSLNASYGDFLQFFDDSFTFDEGIHEIHQSLFWGVLQDTNDPSLALQAFTTVFNQMEYFDSSYKWQFGSSATYIIAEDVSIPIASKGLIAVTAIIASHLATLGFTLLVFLRRTKVSLIGNAWQSVAQVVSDDTLSALDQAGDLRDKEVEKHLVGCSEKEKGMVGVVRRRQNGKVQFGKNEE